MKLIPIAQLSALGKFCIGLIATATGLLQIPQVKDLVVPLAAAHPHFASLIGGVTVISALMSNTQVQTLLGIEQTKTVDTPDGGRATETTSTVITKDPTT